VQEQDARPVVFKEIELHSVIKLDDLPPACQIALFFVCLYAGNESTYSNEAGKTISDGMPHWVSIPPLGPIKIFHKMG
jgi:hypothetical protein